jgi:hypothetical protein
MNMKKRLLSTAARFFGRLMYAALRRLGCKDVEVIEHPTAEQQRGKFSSYLEAVPYETLLEFPRQAF